MSVTSDTHLALREYPVLDLRLHDIYDAALLLFGALVLVLVTADLASDRPEVGLATFLLAVNGAAALIGFAICLRRQYLILLASFFFDYIFLAVAPMQQLRVKFDPIFGNDHALFTTILLCFCFTATAFGSIYFRALPVRRPQRLGFLSRAAFGGSRFHPAVLFCTITIVICVLLAFYGSSLFSTRQTYAENVLAHFDKTTSLLLSTYLNPFVFMGAVLGVLGARAEKKWPWLLGFLVLLVLAEVVNNPIVVARFRSSALMAFALLAFFGWDNARAIASFMVVGMIASPISNSFRYENATAYDIRSFDTFFAHMDYDCFAMMCHIVYYLTYEGFSYGSNLLAALLFFVPRSIWPEKSEHVAYYVWHQVRYYRNVWTDNLSSPPFAEGYYAWGLIGAIGLTMAVFAVLTLLERRAQAAQPGSPYRFIVCVAPMLTIIMHRGPFIVGYSEYWGNVIALLTALALLRMRIRFAPPRPSRA